ncbi:MAG: ABC transporter permease [Anaerolineales bacterium]|jgi:NitT/TauT family transport system permease protein
MPAWYSRGSLSPVGRARARPGCWLQVSTPLIVLAFGLILWQLVATLGRLPSFILPSPPQVATRFLRALADGSLLGNTLVTLEEVLVGLAVGAVAAFALGYLLAKSEWVERLIMPYIVASQAVPAVAIAPLLVIWLGPGLLSKFLLCGLIVFFPVLVNTIVGMRSVEATLRELMRSLKASPWQTFTRLEIPASSPVLLGGLKIGATLSVIGAVVGEFVGADGGLGFLINLGHEQYDTALVFVGILSLILLALALYGSVALCERLLLGWRGQKG